MINDQAGINSRKINFISNDDGYSPPKAVEQVRRLVESDEVRAIFSPMGVPSNTAIQKYLNGRKIPHLFPPSSASKWNEPKNLSVDHGAYRTRVHQRGPDLRSLSPEGKAGREIAVLYQNDDFGKELLRGLKEGLERFPPEVNLIVQMGIP